MRYRSHALIVAGVLCLACGSDSGTTTPGSTAVGFTFSYEDALGLSAVITADSGTWSIDEGSKIVFDIWGAGAEFMGSPVEVFFTNRIAVPGSLLLPPGVYAIGDTLAYEPYLLLLSKEVAGEADGGTVSISRNDASILAGTIDATFHNWRGTSWTLFTLRGPFRLTYQPVAPGSARP